MSVGLESSLEQVDILGRLIGTVRVCWNADLNGSICSEGLFELVDLLGRLIENWYGGLERLFNR